MGFVDKSLRIGVFTAVLAASVFSCAFANVGPQAEGIIPFNHAFPLILIGVFVIDPKGYKKPLSWIAAFFLLRYYTSYAGPFPEVMIYPAIIYYSIKGVQLLRSAESPISKAMRIFLVTLFVLFLGFSIRFANESSAYYFYYEGHQEVSRQVAGIADIIENYGKKSSNQLYPDEETFKAKIYPEPEEFRSIRWQVIEKTILKYEPSEDRKSFVLRYSGGYFQKNPWYMLPAGYPLFRSGKGIEQGERIPYWDAFRIKRGYSR